MHNKIHRTKYDRTPPAFSTNKALQTKYEHKLAALSSTKHYKINQTKYDHSLSAFWINQASQDKSKWMFAKKHGTMEHACNVRGVMVQPQKN